LAKKVQNYYRTKVIKVDDSSITINLATLQRVRILSLKQQLVDAAYIYRFRKGPRRILSPPSTAPASDHSDPGSDEELASLYSALSSSDEDADNDDDEPEAAPPAEAPIDAPANEVLTAGEAGPANTLLAVQQNPAQLGDETVAREEGVGLATNVAEHNQPAGQDNPVPPTQGDGFGHEPQGGGGAHEPQGDGDAHEPQDEPSLWCPIFDPTENEYPRLLRKYSKVNQRAI
jgi:hypothetical protein